MTPLQFAVFDGETVVYNSLSGGLHLLPTMGAQLLQGFEQGIETVELIADLQKNHGLTFQQSEEFVIQSLISYKNLALME